MKSHLKFIALICCAAISVLGLSACMHDSSAPPPPPPAPAPPPPSAPVNQPGS